jgi:hypothetical protein
MFQLLIESSSGLCIYVLYSRMSRSRNYQVYLCTVAVIAPHSVTIMTTVTRTRGGYITVYRLLRNKTIIGKQQDTCSALLDLRLDAQNSYLLT